MRRRDTAKLSRAVVWHGSPQDVARLVAAVRVHCRCSQPRTGDLSLCSVHQILADQHILDGLAFARAVVNRTLDEEWRVPSTPPSDCTQTDWTALLSSCSHDRALTAPSRQGNQSHEPGGRNAFLAAALGLLLLLSVGGWNHWFDPPVDHPIAS
jgi:hypothetical protein